jgi:hypothetical protein
VQTIVLTDGEAVERWVSEVGPLLPVREAAVLRGCSKNAIMDRVSRGRVRRFVLFGHVFVGMREAVGGLVE